MKYLARERIIDVSTMMPKYKEKLPDDKRRMDEVKVKIETKTASVGDTVQKVVDPLSWVDAFDQASTKKKHMDHRLTGGAH